MDGSREFVLRVVPATRAAVTVMSDWPNFIMLAQPGGTAPSNGSYLLQTNGISKVMLMESS